MSRTPSSSSMTRIVAMAVTSSSTSRIRRERAAGLNGFCTNATPVQPRCKTIATSGTPGISLISRDRRDFLGTIGSQLWRAAQEDWEARHSGLSAPADQ